MQDLIPEKLLFFAFERKRYKVAAGGRGSAKSESIARALIFLARYPELFNSASKNIKVLCTRAFQNSISDSVHSLLRRIIVQNGLLGFFKVTDHSIKAINGSEFIFSGLQKIDSLKSIDQIDICWIEEATSVTKSQWDKLTPSIRKAASEIWLSFNPEFQDDKVYFEFMHNKPLAYESSDVIFQFVTWRDNPFFNETLELERKKCERDNPDDYDHIWEGGLKTVSEAQIFKGKYEIREFNTPDAKDCTWGRYFQGVDWGDTNPTVLIRCFIKDESLWVDYEACGVQIDLLEMETFFSTVPTWKTIPTIADNENPSSIRYCKNNLHMNIRACEKGKNSVLDGIKYLKGFRKIYIHPRCTNLAREARLYCFKVDKHTEEVILDVVVKKNDHSWDALRYALEGYMKKSVSLASVPI